MEAAGGGTQGEEGQPPRACAAGSGGDGSQGDGSMEDVSGNGNGDSNRSGSGHGDSNTCQTENTGNSVHGVRPAKRQCVDSGGVIGEQEGAVFGLDEQGHKLVGVRSVARRTPQHAAYDDCVESDLCGRSGQTDSECEFKGCPPKLRGKGRYSHSHKDVGRMKLGHQWGEVGTADETARAEPSSGSEGDGSGNDVAAVASGCGDTGVGPQEGIAAHQVRWFGFHRRWLPLHIYEGSPETVPSRIAYRSLKTHLCTAASERFFRA